MDNGRPSLLRAQIKKGKNMCSHLWMSAWVSPSHTPHRKEGGYQGVRGAVQVEKPTRYGHLT